MEHSLSDYNFEFPKELIASRTAGKGKTHILYCPRHGGERRIMKAPEIVELFRPGDCLVVNNTKVIPARLYGETLHGGKVETLLVQALIPAENGNARYEAQVRPRSGLALKHGITVLNTPGTIDAGYRGEVGVILANFGEADFVVKKGDKIAQIVIAPVTQPEIVEVADVNETDRGAGGFGSTGV